jgi:hypothetical protein
MADHLPPLPHTFDFGDVSQTRNNSSCERISIRGQSLTVTPVFYAYWRFAAERQNIFFRRLKERCSGLTSDPVLERFRFADCTTMSDAFALLRSIPSVGPFLAYQYITDFNYSPLTNFGEDEFVVAGPCALDGIDKCFEGASRVSSADVIRYMHDNQERHFADLQIEFPSLWGRRLQLIDCQNLFCEISKYARVAFPEYAGVAGRIRIKQKYSSKGALPTPWYPPKAAVLQKGDLAKPSGLFDYEKFRSKDFRYLARMSQRSDGPSRAIAELSRNGVSVVVLPALPGTFLDGVAMLAPAGIPVIGLTLRYDRIDGFWFTLLHEVSHIALHYKVLRKNKEAFVDDMDIQSEDVCEHEADELARNVLIPPQFLTQVNWGPHTTQDEIITIATRARVHIAIVAGRWQRDHQNYKKFSRLIERETLRPLLLPSVSS